jgi:hypothetical protein
MPKPPQHVHRKPAEPKTPPKPKSVEPKLPPKPKTLAKGSQKPPEPKVPPKKEKIPGLTTKVAPKKEKVAGVDYVVPQAKTRPEAKPKVEPKVEPTATSTPKAAEPKVKKMRLKVMREMKSPEEWKQLRFRERVDHQEKMKELLPAGTVGQAILRKQGRTCDSCSTLRRRSSPKAAARAKELVRRWQEANRKKSLTVEGSNFARSYFNRERLVGNKRKRTVEAEEPVAKEDPPSDPESVEPEAWEEAEEERPLEVDEEDEEVPEPKTPPEQVEGGRSEAVRPVATTAGASPAGGEPEEVHPVVADASSASASPGMLNTLREQLLSTNLRNAIMLKQKMAMASDEELEGIEESLKRLEAEREQLKQRPKVKEVQKKDLLDQSSHDSRYRADIRAGIPHSKAWKAEKARRRSAEHRRKTLRDRVQEAKDAERSWHEAFDSGVPEPGDVTDRSAENADVETEFVDREGKPLEKGSATYERRPLSRKEREYARVERDELPPPPKPKKEPREVPREKRQLANKRRNDRRLRLKKALARKGEKFLKKRKRPSETGTRQDEDDSDENWGDWEPTEVGDPLGGKGPGRGDPGAGTPAICSLTATASGSRAGGLNGVEVNFDTGAAVTVLPAGVGDPTGPANGVTYRTASGEILKDEGHATLRGTTKTGHEMNLTGRTTGVKRALASGAAVCQYYCALHGKGGMLLAKDSEAGKKFQAFMAKLQREMKQEEYIKMSVKRGIYVFDVDPFHGHPEQE